MKLKKILAVIGMSTLLLAACGDKDDTKKEETKTTSETKSATDSKSTADSKSSTDTKSTTSDENKATDSETQVPKLEEAKNIPADEKKALLDVFQRYIDTFNNEDIKGYMATISPHPLNFKYDEEKNTVQQVFDQLDVRRTASKVTITDFQIKKADIYSELRAVTKDPNSDNEAVRNIKQISIFNKTKDGWKLVAIHPMSIVDEKKDDSKATKE